MFHPVTSTRRSHRFVTSTSSAPVAAGRSRVSFVARVSIPSRGSAFSLLERGARGPHRHHVVFFFCEFNHILIQTLLSLEEGF
ncbi:hypothetical protein EYF80_063511 [Liparis tanakae]|uniref:Uncharacterized protein n=1 Tax=Liparis tanakae TaxID=230148 RepID=A0A4Z2EDJ1_9TELE|nr:hypothetical protein EYF80_063511 [Liparis tanakae]